MASIDDNAGEMDLELDPAVLKELPADGSVLAVYRHGMTNWSTGFKIEVEVGDDEKAYFLKVIDREHALEMAHGEFESQKALWSVLPDNISVPLAYGQFELDPSKAFFLTEFRDLDPRILEVKQLVDILQPLHQNSQSPTGKFGFPTPTFKGYLPVNNDWCDTWEEYFTRQFRAELTWEQSIRGEDPEIEELAVPLFEKVIPRLLRPLQTGGRSIKPVLCHGDLWHGNIEIDMATQKPILFDSCCVYGHNEFDLSLMKANRYRLNADHVTGYLKEMKPSEPREDFDDRLTLYALRNDIVVAGLWHNWSHLREVAKEDMRALIAKYPEGLDMLPPSNEASDVVKGASEVSASAIGVTA